MRAAHQPEAFGVVLDPVEMDRMVEVFRMHVRDYEADELSEQMLVMLEEAYANSGRELAGGRSIDMRFLLGDPDLLELPAGEDEEGGTAVTS